MCCAPNRYALGTRDCPHPCHRLCCCKDAENAATAEAEELAAAASASAVTKGDSKNDRGDSKNDAKLSLDSPSSPSSPSGKSAADLAPLPTEGAFVPLEFPIDR